MQRLPKYQDIELYLGIKWQVMQLDNIQKNEMTQRYDKRHR